MGDSEKRRYVVVLHEGVVDSPQAAVKAAIIGDYGNRHRAALKRAGIEQLP